MTAPREISLKGCRTRAEARERIETFLDAIREEHIEREIAKVQWRWILDDGDEPDPDFQQQTEQLRAAFTNFGREDAARVIENILDDICGPERQAKGPSESQQARLFDN